MPITAKSCLVPAILAVALGACTNAKPEESLPPAPPATMEPNCGADQLGAYIGSKATDDVIAAIRTWRGEHPIRVLKPDSMVTMDYRPDRLNIDVDGNGTIKGFRCT